MKNTEIEAAEGGPETWPCTGRRQFLTRTVAGGVAIALGGASFSCAARADDANAPDETAKTYELVVKPSDYPELAQVGGWATIETKIGKITVARVSQTQFSAVGAVCTHKGGPIEYNGEAQQFFCPWHGSKFDVEGAVVKGPAKIALPKYQGETAAVIKLS